MQTTAQGEIQRAGQYIVLAKRQTGDRSQPSKGRRPDAGTQLQDALSPARQARRENTHDPRQEEGSAEGGRLAPSLHRNEDQGVPADLPGPVREGRGRITERSIEIEGHILQRDEAEAFAVRDGFQGLAEMLRFWRRYNTLPFSGDVIHWDYARRTRMSLTKLKKLLGLTEWRIAA